MKIKMLLLGLFAISLLGLSRPEVSFATDYEITTYGYGDILSEGLTAAIKTLNDSNFHLIAKIIVGISFFILSASLVFGLRGERAVEYAKLFVFGTIIMQAFLGTSMRDRLLIVDEPLGLNVLVADVPVGISKPAMAFSTIETSLMTLFERYFTNASFRINTANPMLSLSYSQAGFAFSLNYLANLGDFTLTDPYLRRTMDEYIENCLFYDVLDGSMNINTMMNSTDFFNDMSSTSTRYTAIYTTAIPRGYVVQCKDAWDSTTDLNSIKPRVLAFMDGGTPEYPVGAKDKFAQGLGFGTFTGIQNRFGVVNSSILGISKTAGETLLNTLGMNMFDSSVAKQAALSGIDPNVLAYGTALAESQQRSTFATSGALAKKYLPMVKGIITTIVYCSLPLTVLLMFSPFGFNYLKMMFTLLLWLVLWNPLLAILNLIINVRASGVLTASIGAEGYSLATKSIVSSYCLDTLAWASYFAWLIPVISFMLAKASEYAFVQLAGDIKGSMAGAAAAGGAAAATGNISYANVAHDTWSSNKIDSVATNSSGNRRSVVSESPEHSLDTKTGVSTINGTHAGRNGLPSFSTSAAMKPVIAYSGASMNQKEGEAETFTTSSYGSGYSLTTDRSGKLIDSKIGGNPAESFAGVSAGTVNGDSYAIKEALNRVNDWSYTGSSVWESSFGKNKEISSAYQNVVNSAANGTITGQKTWGNEFGRQVTNATQKRWQTGESFGSNFHVGAQLDGKNKEKIESAVAASTAGVGGAGGVLIAGGMALLRSAEGGYNVAYKNDRGWEWGGSVSEQEAESIKKSTTATLAKSKTSGSADADAIAAAVKKSTSEKDALSESYTDGKRWAASVAESIDHSQQNYLKGDTSAGFSFSRQAIPLAAEYFGFTNPDDSRYANDPEMRENLQERNTKGLGLANGYALDHLTGLAYKTLNGTPEERSAAKKEINGFVDYMSERNSGLTGVSAEMKNRLATQGVNPEDFQQVRDTAADIRGEAVPRAGAAAIAARHDAGTRTVDQGTAAVDAAGIQTSHLKNRETIRREATEGGYSPDERQREIPHNNPYFREVAAKGQDLLGQAGEIHTQVDDKNQEKHNFTKIGGALRTISDKVDHATTMPRSPQPLPGDMASLGDTVARLPNAPDTPEGVREANEKLIKENPTAFGTPKAAPDATFGPLHGTSDPVHLGGFTDSGRTPPPMPKDGGNTSGNLQEGETHLSTGTKPSLGSRGNQTPSIDSAVPTETPHQNVVRKEDTGNVHKPTGIIAPFAPVAVLSGYAGLEKDQENKAWTVQEVQAETARAYGLKTGDFRGANPKDVQMYLAQVEHNLNTLNSQGRVVGGGNQNGGGGAAGPAPFAQASPVGEGSPSETSRGNGLRTPLFQGTLFKNQDDQDMNSWRKNATAEVQSMLSSQKGKDGQAYYQGEVNGKYDKELATAVGKYQKENDLKSTNAIDAPTWAKLFGGEPILSPAPKPPPPENTVLAAPTKSGSPEEHQSARVEPVPHGRSAIETPSSGLPSIEDTKPGKPESTSLPPPAGGVSPLRILGGTGPEFLRKEGESQVSIPMRHSDYGPEDQREESKFNFKVAPVGNPADTPNAYMYTTPKEGNRNFAAVSMKDDQGSIVPLFPFRDPSTGATALVGTSSDGRQHGYVFGSDGKLAMVATPSGKNTTPENMGQEILGKYHTSSESPKTPMSADLASIPLREGIQQGVSPSTLSSPGGYDLRTTRGYVPGRHETANPHDREIVQVGENGEVTFSPYSRTGEPIDSVPMKVFHESNSGNTLMVGHDNQGNTHFLMSDRSGHILDNTRIATADGAEHGAEARQYFTDILPGKFTEQDLTGKSKPGLGVEEGIPTRSFHESGTGNTLFVGHDKQGNTRYLLTDHDGKLLEKTAVPTEKTGGNFESEARQYFTSTLSGAEKQYTAPEKNPYINPLLSEGIKPGKTSAILGTPGSYTLPYEGHNFPRIHTERDGGITYDNPITGEKIPMMPFYDSRTESTYLVGQSPNTGVYTGIEVTRYGQARSIQSEEGNVTTGQSSGENGLRQFAQKMADGNYRENPEFKEGIPGNLASKGIHSREEQADRGIQDSIGYHADLRESLQHGGAPLSVLQDLDQFATGRISKLTADHDKIHNTASDAPRNNEGNAIKGDRNSWPSYEVPVPKAVKTAFDDDGKEYRSGAWVAAASKEETGLLLKNAPPGAVVQNLWDKDGGLSYVPINRGKVAEEPEYSGYQAALMRDWRKDPREREYAIGSAGIRGIEHMLGPAANHNLSDEDHKNTTAFLSAHGYAGGGSPERAEILQKVSQDVRSGNFKLESPENVLTMLDREGERNRRVTAGTSTATPAGLSGPAQISEETLFDKYRFRENRTGGYVVSENQGKTWRDVQPNERFVDGEGKNQVEFKSMKSESGDRNEMGPISRVEKSAGAGSTIRKEDDERHNQIQPQLPDPPAFGAGEPGRFRNFQWNDNPHFVGLSDNDKTLAVGALTRLQEENPGAKQLKAALAKYVGQVANGGASYRDKAVASKFFESIADLLGTAVQKWGK